MRSVKTAAILASLFSAAVAQADPIFSESFETGAAAWSAGDGNALTITTEDTTACSTSFQHEPTGGRLVYTNDAFATTGGDTYCLSAWVRATGDAQPFLGVFSLDDAGTGYGYRWLIGNDGFDNGFGDTVTAVTADGAWHWYAAAVALDPATTMTSVLEQLIGSDGSADFDAIRLTAGPCATAYAGADQHQVCASDAVCTASGACETMTPPGDMGGTSTGPVASSTGNNTTFTPPTSTPVAAEGTPSNTGAVTTTAAGGGGCSMSGTESGSFGVMMLAFAAVLLVARRRRA